MRAVVNKTKSNNNNPKIALLLNIINKDFDYNKLDYVDDVYIPLKYFTNKQYETCLKTISKKFDTYIYMLQLLEEITKIYF